MRTILAIAASAVCIACSSGEPERSPVTTTADGSRYVNEFFRLEVTKPEGWFAQDAELTLKMNQQGAELVAGDDKNTKTIIAQSLKSSIPVFGFFQHPPGAAVEVNPSILSLAENVSVLPGIKTGCDYLFHARKLLERSAMKVSVKDGCQTTQINGASLGYIDTTMNVGSREIRQRYYACVQGEHALSIIQTYVDDETKQLVDDPLKSLSVACN